MTANVDLTPKEIVDRVRESVGDVSEARTLPAECYTSPSFFEFERSAIFGRAWLFLCHVSQVPHPGDFYSVTVAGEPLVVVRGQDNQIRVLSAVCQHRGSVLTEGCGNARHLKCPYHSWSYELDGRLAGAPSMHPAHSLADLKAEIALPALRVEIWEGLVFATFDPQTRSLAETAKEAQAAVAPYRVGEMVVEREVTLADLPFNWKNMQENALEEYHTTYVHKGFHENVPADRVVHGEFASGNGAVYRHAGMIIKGGEPVPGRPNFPLIKDLPEHERGHFLFLAVPPLHFAAVRPDGVKMFRIVPSAVDRMSLTIMFVFPPSTLEVPGFDQMMNRQLELIELLDRPDVESNTRMFKGLQSRFAPRGPFSPQESTLPQFNQWLLDHYVSALDSDFD